MFNIGDYVTRNSYNNDIIFKIIRVDNDIYYLKGVSVRLYADSFKTAINTTEKEIEFEIYHTGMEDEKLSSENSHSL